MVVVDVVEFGGFEVAGRVGLVGGGWWWVEGLGGEVVMGVICGLLAGVVEVWHWAVWAGWFEVASTAHAHVHVSRGSGLGLGDGLLWN